jgi:hypothetical protein
VAAPSGLRVFFGFELAREVESQFAEPPAQSLAGNPQAAGGLMLWELIEQVDRLSIETLRDQVRIAADPDRTVGP